MTLLDSPARSMRAKFSRLAPHWTALLLFLLTLALRLPWLSQTLNHWDSVNHALALTTYNVPANRPQPPGYIVYIGMGRLLYMLFPDPQTALVAVSVLASALAVALLFLLGTRLHSQSVGLIAALLLLTSPAFWFDGLVALPYVVEGCLSIAMAFLLYRLWRGETRLAPLTAIVFALSVGARQQMFFYFAPLVLYVYWKQSWRVRVESVLWFAFGCVLWFVPLIWSAGGIARYLVAVRNYNELFQERFVLSGTGGIRALLRNAMLIAAYTLYALNLAALPFAYAGFAFLRRNGVRAAWGNERARFVLLWITPSLVLYLIFHMGSPGLIYVYFSALLLVAAVGIVWLTRNSMWRAALVAVLCVVNVFIFFGTPPDLYTGQDIRVLNYSSLRAHDTALLSRTASIRQHFDAQTTLVLSKDWRFPEYYLPEYTVVNFTGEKARPVLLLHNQQEKYTRPAEAALNLPGIKTIVMFDADAKTFYRGNAAAQCLPLADGACLAYYAVSNPLELQTNALTEKTP